MTGEIFGAMQATFFFSGVQGALFVVVASGGQGHFLVVFFFISGVPGGQGPVLIVFPALQGTWTHSSLAWHFFVLFVGVQGLFFVLIRFSTVIVNSPDATSKHCVTMPSRGLSLEVTALHVAAPLL